MAALSCTCAPWLMSLIWLRTIAYFDVTNVKGYDAKQPNWVVAGCAEHSCTVLRTRRKWRRSWRRSVSLPRKLTSSTSSVSTHLVLGSVVYQLIASSLFRSVRVEEPKQCILQWNFGRRNANSSNCIFGSGLGTCVPTETSPRQGLGTLHCSHAFPPTLIPDCLSVLQCWCVSDAVQRRFNKRSIGWSLPERTWRATLSEHSALWSSTKLKHPTDDIGRYAETMWHLHMSLSAAGHCTVGSSPGWAPPQA